MLTPEQIVNAIDEEIISEVSMMCEDNQSGMTAMLGEELFNQIVNFK